MRRAAVEYEEEPAGVLSLLTRTLHIPLTLRLPLISTSSTRSPPIPTLSLTFPIARNRQNREMLALPGGGRERRERRLALEGAATTADGGDLPRELAEDDDFEPETGDVVKFFNAFAGVGGTTYTATIKSMEANIEGKMVYRIEYFEGDETTHAVTRKTFLETLSSLPQPARKFVEFGHDELKLIWEPDVHITNLHQDMNTHEEVNYLPSSA